MKPRVSILSKRFRYRNSAHTDIRETFREHKEREAEQQRNAEEAQRKTVQMRGKRG